MNVNPQTKVLMGRGGAPGMGRATATAFEREGATAVVWDVTMEPKIHVTSRESVEAAVAAVMAKHGRIDVLVNNAGILRDAQLVKYKDGEVTGMMDDAAFDAVVNVNLRAVFVCTRAVVPHMIKAAPALVLTASSIVRLYA